MSLPRYISVDLILPARDMARVDRAVADSQDKFATWVREAVRNLAAREGVKLAEVRSLPRVGPWAPDRYDVSKQRHAILFPRSWHSTLNRLAKRLGNSKSGVLRIAVLQRVNGIK